jgi:hypothetical protein
MQARIPLWPDHAQPAHATVPAASAWWPPLRVEPSTLMGLHSCVFGPRVVAGAPGPANPAGRYAVPLIRTSRQNGPIPVQG